MTDHLPECLHDWPDLPVCICDELRTREKRALDAAREAVAALTIPRGFDPSNTLEWMQGPAVVLAAIDALRESK